jgi:hypothetical protein
VTLRRALIYFALGVLVGHVALPLAALIANAQTYAVATITSWHFDRDKKYNEDNFGLGLERRLSDTWSLSAGYFRNSFDRHTNYVFAGYTPVEVYGWRTGVVMGGVSGYDDGISPWLTGVMTRDFGRVGLNVVFSAGGVALQVKLRIGR